LTAIKIDSIRFQANNQANMEMEIQDEYARQLFIRIIAKRREYILKQLATTYPEKKEKIERLKPILFQHECLEPRVKESREV
jgi:hypothetical protein